MQKYKYNQFIQYISCLPGNTLAALHIFVPRPGSRCFYYWQVYALLTIVLNILSRDMYEETKIFLFSEDKSTK